MMPKLPRAFRSRSALATLMLCAALASLWTLAGRKVWKEREDTLARASVDIRNLTHSLAQHAARTVEGASVILSAVGERVGAAQPPTADAFNATLKSYVGQLPQLREIVVLDEAGSWKYASTGILQPYSNADRDYFKYHQAHADAALRINTPILSRSTNRWTLILTRRISRADGSFAGVAVAAIDLDHFQALYDTFAIGQRGAISLFRTDGVLLVRRPFIATNVGRDVSSLAVFKRLPESPTGFYRTTSPLDATVRWTAYEQLADVPLAVGLALAEDEILAPWRRDMESDFAVTGGISLLLILMGALILAQLRMRAQADQALRKSEAEYRLLAENAGDVVLRLDLDGTRRYISPSIRQLLGYEPAELLGRRPLEILHPDHVGEFAEALARM